MTHRHFVMGYKLEKVNPREKDFHWIYDKMHRTNHSSSKVQNYEIVEVFRILNGKTWPNYQKTRHRIYTELGQKHRVEERRLFHATPNAQVIGNEGFNLQFARSQGLFGAGIYFAEHSSKSNNYAFGLGKGCPSHGKADCSSCVRTMLVCKVAMGKVHPTNSTGTTLPQGCHSVHFTLAGRESEIIVYDDTQAYPSYLIKYRAHFKS